MAGISGLKAQWFNAASFTSLRLAKRWKDERKFINPYWYLH